MDADKKARLEALDQKLRAFEAERDAPKAKNQAAVEYTHLSLAYRMVIEMASGVLIGLVIGLSLDRLLGTKPWFLVIMILVGTAAGMRVMMQSAREFERQQKKNEEANGN